MYIQLALAIMHLTRSISEGSKKLTNQCWGKDNKYLGLCTLLISSVAALWHHSLFNCHMQEISSCNILISCVPQINPKELILISIPITALVRTPWVTYTHSVDFICGVSKVNRNYLHSGLLVFTMLSLKIQKVISMMSRCLILTRRTSGY